MCGKDGNSAFCRWKSAGSPPRVREGLLANYEACERNRITPACAGRTHPRCGRIRSIWDHPRVCGKDTLYRKSKNARKGSPPRVREGLSPTRRHSYHRRIPPACAGRTNASNSRSIVIKGSPPRVREGQVLLISSTQYVRITPACAGRTSIKAIHAVVFEDHPRVCGKDSSTSSCMVKMTGSPPRVREGL